MRPHKTAVLAVAMAIGLAGLSARAQTAPLAANSTIPPFALPDQRDQLHQVDQGTRLLLFSRDKDVAKMAFGVLGQKEPSYLADRQANLILDVSDMPSIITWLIAKPRMRRHAFPLLLDAEPCATKGFPTKDGQLTLLYLNKLKVEDVKFVSTGDALKSELERLAR